MTFGWLVVRIIRGTHLETRRLLRIAFCAILGFTKNVGALVSLMLQLNLLLDSEYDDPYGLKIYNKTSSPPHSIIFPYLNMKTESLINTWKGFNNSAGHCTRWRN